MTQISQIRTRAINMTPDAFVALHSMIAVCSVFEI